jgi:hydroxymethylpyrimidine/phosphomethylpyrimidine kinase
LLKFTAEGQDRIDVLWTEDGQAHRFSSPAIQTGNTHGSGCAYSAAITALLAKNVDLPSAVDQAKRYITKAIETNPELGRDIGHGPINFFAEG